MSTPIEIENSVKYSDAIKLLTPPRHPSILPILSSKGQLKGCKHTSISSTYPDELVGRLFSDTFRFPSCFGKTGKQIFYFNTFKFPIPSPKVRNGFSVIIPIPKSSGYICPFPFPKFAVLCASQRSKSHKLQINTLWKSKFESCWS